MKRKVSAIFSSILLILAVDALADVPPSQVLIEVQVADLRIADLSTLGFSYDVSGSHFNTTVSVEQEPSGKLFGNAYITDIFSDETFVLPLDGQLKVGGRGPLRFNLGGRSDLPRLSVNIRGDGDANLLHLQSNVSRPGLATDIVRLDVVPIITDSGVTIHIDPKSISVIGNTAQGMGTAILPGTANPLLVDTRETVDGSRFSFSAQSADGKFQTNFSGLGQLPVVDRLFKGTVNPGYGLLIIQKPTLVLMTAD